MHGIFWELRDAAVQDLEASFVFAAISARFGKIYAAWSENCDMESVVRQSTLAVKVLAGSLLV